MEEKSVPPQQKHFHVIIAESQAPLQYFKYFLSIFSIHILRKKHFVVAFGVKLKSHFYITCIICDQWAQQTN